MSDRHQAAAALRFLARTGTPGQIDGVRCRCRRLVVLGVIRVELVHDCPHHGADSDTWRDLTAYLQCGTDKG